MKRTHTFLLLVAAAALTQAQESDTARRIVDRYLARLNYEALRSDSMLYVESRIFAPNSTDTVVMRRWHQEPNIDRVELWQGGQLGKGMFTNGKGICMEYNAQRRKWALISHETFLSQQMPYDFRSPLYKYHINGLELTYMGVLTYKGIPCQRVLVHTPNRYDRYYLFEAESGLLFLIDELETVADGKASEATHVDWRAVHEYQPFGQSLLPSIESYQDRQGITIIKHTFQYLPYDSSLFEEHR